MPDTNTAATISSPAIELTTLPRTLAAVFGCPPPAYGPLWRAAVEGRIPAHQVGDRWHFRAADVPAIGAALGLGARAELQAA